MIDDPSTVDLTDLANFAHGLPHHLFEIHRRVAPVWWRAVWWHEPPHRIAPPPAAHDAVSVNEIRRRPAQVPIGAKSGRCSSHNDSSVLRGPSTAPDW
jgi:hypothetical protein